MSEAIRTIAPSALPVTLAELKAQARVDATDEDALLAAYIRAAVEEVERYARLSLITQTWEERFPAFTKEMTAHIKPIQSIETVEYLDTGGALQTLDAAVFQVAGIGADKTYPRVRLGVSQSWPTTLEHPEAVRITVVAGYGDTHNDVPELIRHAVLLTAATWINHREDVTSESLSEMPWASKALLRDWRPLAVA